VVAAVLDAPPAPTPLAPRRARRFVPGLGALVAACLVLVAAAVVLRRGDTESPRTVLAAAAKRTEAAGSARLRVRGETTFTLPVPSRGGAPRTPDFAAVPVELRAGVEARWESALAEFERALAAYEDEVQRLVDETDALLRNPFGARPTRPARPLRPTRPPRPTPAPPVPPATLETTVRLDARGEVAFGERLRLAGDVGAGGLVPFQLATGPDGSEVVVRGRWAVAGDAAAPWGRVLGDPRGVVGLVATATAVRDLGGGRYAFTAGATAGEATVSADGLLAAVALDGTGSTGGATWRSVVSVELSDPGAPVGPGGIDPKIPARPAPARGPSAVLFPLGPGVAAAEEER
jgi:hypothetical protein